MAVKLCFYQRLSLATISIFLLITSSFVWWSNAMQERTKHQAEQQLHINLAKHLVDDNPLLKEGVFDYQALGNLFHTLMVMGPNFEFYYLDNQGQILTFNAEPGKVKTQQVALEPIKRLLENPEQLPIYGSNPKDPHQDKIFSVAPVYKEQQQQGYLYVILGGEQYDTIIKKLSNDRNFAQFTLLGVTTLVLFLVLMVCLFAWLTKPMKKLTLAMDSVRAADYDLSRSGYTPMHWDRDSIDEVQKLGCAFNDMVAHIQGQFEALQALDSRRRALLADLSHDLRTPLANLQGYIETLAINHQNLSLEDKERFIQISLKNAQNLKHLIDQIFELAYIEAGQVTLHKEPFPIAELVHDIAAKFTLNAQEKNIRLQVQAEQSDAMVYADIGKLERVLTNLIENAIRHTPENGKVTLSIVSQCNGVAVSVADNGVGIPANELQHVFEARYQASNSEKDRHIHAGLGLAICKKLMELNDSSLTVSSEKGRGTCFSFVLPTPAE